MIYLNKRPYIGSTRKEIRNQIVSGQAKIHDNEKRSDWSQDSVDFINALLQRKQSYRLGNDKPGSAKKHSWFNGFDWQALENGTMKSPFFGIVSCLLLNMWVEIVGIRKRPFE